MCFDNGLMHFVDTVITGLSSNVTRLRIRDRLLLKLGFILGETFPPHVPTPPKRS